MKNLLYLLSLLFLFVLPRAHAAHISGAELTYRYIGDTSGVPFEYMVYLKVYKNATSSVALPSQEQLEVSSSCFSNFSFNVNRYTEPGDSVLADNGVYVPGYGSCVDQSSPDYLSVSLNKYKGRVSLPDTCSDFLFFWWDFGRNSAIDNIQMAQSTNIYVEAFLNNTGGPNSAAQFFTPGAAAFCLGQDVYWPQQASQRDSADSLSFRLATPLTYPRAPVTFAAGYSQSQPITTANGININGGFSFVPTAVEFVIVKIVADDYRFFSGVWNKVGSSEREMPVVVVAGCNLTTQNDIFFGTKDPNLPPNIPSFLTVSCFSDSIVLTSSIPIRGSSVSPDGSDFRLIGSDSLSRPVVAAKADILANGFTKKIILKLHRPLSQNDTMLLEVKNGFDLNTLINECGSEMPEFTAAFIYVNNCPNSSLQEWENQPVQVFPVPASEVLQVLIPDPSHQAFLEVFDLNGKLLLQKYDLKKETALEVGDLPPGLYILKYKDGRNGQVIRFTK